MAAPPAVAWAAPAAAAWLQYLVPLLGGAGSLAFLLAVPGPRHPLLVVAVAGTGVASLALGVALRLHERRARRAWRRERSRYLGHLAQVAAAADRLAAAQLAAADHLHPDPPRLWTLVCRAERLWERRPADGDFLTVRVGRGPVPLHAPLRLDTAGGPLVERDAGLLAAAEALVRRAAWLPAAPVTVPLRHLGVVALTGPRDRARALARALLCQLAAFHAPDDLRILAGFPPAALPAWDWLKWLPHTRDPAPGEGGMPGCLLAGTPAQLAALLDREVRPRLAAAGAGSGPPAHLVVLLELDPAGRGTRGPPPLLEELLDRAPAAGVTVLWLAGTPAGEPSELAARVLLDEHGAALFQETAPGGRRIEGIGADAAGLAVCEAIARRLAPLRLDRRPTAAPTVRSACSTCSAPATTRPGRRPRPARRSPGPHVRRSPRPPGTHGARSRTPPGAGPSCCGSRSARDRTAPRSCSTSRRRPRGGIGPHGLVVGATGSGKSELLRTIVAGLAATHPPELLGFVLVDFKGGAAFADLAGLPQVAGLITNLHGQLAEAYLRTRLRSMATRAGIYVRISRDPAGDMLGIQRQEPPCRALCDRLGWQVAEVYADDDTSAYNGRHRPAYERMLRDVEAGHVQAIVAWDADRLTRRPIENEGLIDLAERLGVKLATVTGEYDLATSSGRLHFRIKGAIARHESEHRAERLRLKHEQLAQAGKANGGGRPFGYNNDRLTICEPEAALIREAVQRLLAGDSIRRVVRDWEARRIQTPRRRAWVSSTFRDMIRSPRLAGKRAHRGVIVGDATWPAIITWEQHLQLVAILDDAARVHGSRSARVRRYLLTGFLVCGRCGAKLVAQPKGDVRGYACAVGAGRAGCGRTTRLAEPLEAHVRDAIIKALDDPAVIAALRAVQGAADASSMGELVDQLRDGQAQLEDLGRDYADGLITREAFFAAQRRVTDRLDATRRELSRVAQDQAAVLIPAGGAEAVRAAWDSEGLEWQRALVGRMVERVTLHPCIRGRHSFDATRVELTWRV